MNEAISLYQHGEPIAGVLLKSGVSKSALYRALSARGLVQRRREALPIEEKKARQIRRARAYRAAHPVNRVRRFGLDIERDRATRAARVRRERETNPEPRRAANHRWRATHLEQARSDQRARRTANPEKTRAANAKRREAHREEARETTRLWRESHPGASLAASLAWQKAHPEEVRARTQRRRARLLGVPGNGVTASEWASVLITFENRCAYCWADDVSLHMDHVVPIARGGAHEPENVVPACRSCNSSKGARTPEEWVATSEAA